ncbi:MAG: type II secretion system F family protein [Candidatus Falkowbacteria bacterium]
MPLYSYKALNSKDRAVHGRAVAFNTDGVARNLAHKGLRLVWANDISDRADTRVMFFIQGVKPKDLVIFSREFSLMISSDVSVLESLQTVLEQTENLKLKNIISNVAIDVDGGALLSESFKRRGGKAFSEFYVNVVKAGETSGKLDEVLLYLADEMEKDYDLIGKFKGAMVYPAIVSIGLVVVGFIMMYFVMPQLTTIIEESGTALPLPTVIVIAVVDFLQAYLVYIIIALVAAFVAIRIAARTPAGKETLDIIKLKIPIIGKLYRLIYLVRFCRSFSTLLYGGVTVTRALEVSSDVVRSVVYQKLILKTLEAVNEGYSISYVFADSPYMPKMIPQMLSIGEKTGNLDAVLGKISDFYTRELNDKLANLNVILEPAIMLVMGVAVAIMAAAIIMPMYSVALSF